ncbi:hypothetical protein Hanom_Chr16g01490631 [Helianthus anomalus]
MVFLTEFGIGLMYFQTKDFQPNVWMGDAIINCFALMLNCEDANRTKGVQETGPPASKAIPTTCVAATTDCLDYFYVDYVDECLIILFALGFNLFSYSKKG